MVILVPLHTYPYETGSITPGTISVRSLIKYLILSGFYLVKLPSVSRDTTVHP